jgi:hypothetical protein
LTLIKKSAIFVFFLGNYNEKTARKIVKTYPFYA